MVIERAIVQLNWHFSQLFGAINCPNGRGPCALNLLWMIKRKVMMFPIIYTLKNPWVDIDMFTNGDIKMYTVRYI